MFSTQEGHDSRQVAPLSFHQVVRVWSLPDDIYTWWVSSSSTKYSTEALNRASLARPPQTSRITGHEEIVLNTLLLKCNAETCDTAPRRLSLYKLPCRKKAARALLSAAPPSFRTHYLSVKRRRKRQDRDALPQHSERERQRRKKEQGLEEEEEEEEERGSSGKSRRKTVTPESDAAAAADEAGASA